MKCNKQYVLYLFHMLHFYYDRQEQILTPESYKYNTKKKYRLKMKSPVVTDAETG